MRVLYMGGFTPENFAEVHDTYMCTDFYQLDCVKNSVFKIGEWMCTRSDHVLNVLSVLNIKERVTPELEGIKHKAHCCLAENLEEFVTSKSIFSC